MKSKIVLGVMLGLLLAAKAFGSFTQVTYQVAQLSSVRWQYNYEIANISLASPIEEFTIWFDYNAPYSDLAIETPEPPASDWDEIVWQPNLIWSIDGGYDALATGDGIGSGETVGGFAVSFDWLGTDEPGPQFYDIINPQPFGTICSGMTEESIFVIPLPGALLLGLIGTGTVGLLHRLSSRNARRR